MWSGITGVIIGILIGGVAAWIWLKGRSGSAGSVETLKRENERFREEVNEHFVQTAELINQLTDSYKAVFDHLSDGAEKLVDQDAVRERMPQVSDEEVRLKRLGAPLEKSVAEEAAPATEESVDAKDDTETSATEPRQDPTDEERRFGEEGPAGEADKDEAGKGDNADKDAEKDKGGKRDQSS